MNKYYAVKKGYNIGIFSNWEECKKNIDGFSGAEYKSFADLKDAENYLLNKQDEIIDNILPEEVFAYVDGSFSEKLQRYSYGCVIITPTKDIYRLKDSGNELEAIKNRNIAGELKGVMVAVKWAFDNGYKYISIFHDYYGIAKWFSGEWKAKSYVSMKYKEFLEKYRDLIKIKFIKVKGHAGNKYNELADKLAKEALL